MIKNRFHSTLKKYEDMKNKNNNVDNKNIIINSENNEIKMNVIIIMKILK